MAMVLGVPHLVLPSKFSNHGVVFEDVGDASINKTNAVGQLPYQSRISGRLEHRPISASLMGCKGRGPYGRVYGQR